MAVLCVAVGACGVPELPRVAVGPAGYGRADETDASKNVLPSEFASENEAAVPIDKDDPVRGKRDAWVTVVVWSDFQCPFCGRLADTLRRVAETYKDDVRFVFKNDPLPFHEHARMAAEVGQGVFALQGSEAFWRYHDFAFRQVSRISPEAIRGWAIAAGADSRALEDGLTRKAWSAKVARDEAVGKRLGVKGTPASFVNGVLLDGAQPFENWQTVIDIELQKAKALSATVGVGREQLYARAASANVAASKVSKATKPERESDDDKPDTSVWRVPVGTSPVRGGRAALVTIVEFSDFQCPFCKKVEPTLERLRAEYGDRLRIVWKDEPLPFHPRALPAALLARAARAQKGDAGFWSAHDKLFAAQPNLEESDLEAIARSLSVEVAAMRDGAKARAQTKAIEEDIALGDDVHANGAPHFFINGRRLIGAQPYESFKAAIDEELLKAEGLVRSGVAKEALYDALIKDGTSAPEPERKIVAFPSSAPFRGSANAKVIIQEFSDFQCPFCGRAEATMDELLRLYPGQLKVVWRNLPLAMHADAPLAAEAAREAFAQKGNDGFSKFRALVFEHQREEDGLKRAALESYAATVGLEVTKFGKALDDRVHRVVVEEDAKAANDAGIAGTPSFLVGPYALSGAQPLSKFKRLVERALTAPPAAKLPAAK